MPPRNHISSAKLFAQTLANDPTSVSKTYLSQFGNVLSTRLACELCPEYFPLIDLSDTNPFRVLVHETAKKIKDHVWNKILESNPTLPVVIIAGGGPGSGTLTTIRNPASRLQSEVAAIYDASDENIWMLESLIYNLHAKNIPAIVVYIERPLRDAAASVIVRAAKDKTILGIHDAQGFGRKHANTLGHFLATVTRYQKKRNLFHPFVILNHPTRTGITTDSRKLRENWFTSDHATNIFLHVAQELRDKSSALHKVDRVQDLTLVKKARKNKKYPPFAFEIARQLSETLRKNLVARRNHLREVRLNQATTSIVESPPIALIHQRHAQDKGLEERTEAWRDRTAEGREKTLDREHPQRIAFKEKTTHPHEMEQELIR